MPSKDMIGRVLSTGSATVSGEHVADCARARRPEPALPRSRRRPARAVRHGRGAADLPDRVHDPGHGGRDGRVPRARAELHDARSRRAGVRVRAPDPGRRDPDPDRSHRRRLRKDRIERPARLRRARDRGARHGGSARVLLTQYAHLAADVMAALDARSAVPGAELPPLVKGPVDRDMLKAYAAASGDPNPMHTDDEFARNAGYPGVFAHGMLSMGWLGEFLVRAGGVGSIRRFRARFAKLTWPGET